MATDLRSRRPHHGFTLVELLVVIAIIGILVALLLPAVQAAREAARRTQCQNHLKQLSLALHNYHDANEVFPPSSHFDPSAGSPDESSVHYVNWVISLLPYFEEQTLYDRFDLDLPISDQANREPRGTAIEGMVCPSDDGHGVKFAATGEGDNWARGNFGANGALAPYSYNKWPSVDAAGPDAARWKDPLTGGVMGANVALRISQITDGTGQTILLGELRVGLASVDRRGTWALGGPGSSASWMHGSDNSLSPNDCLPGSDNLKGSPEVNSAVGVDTLQRECMTTGTITSTQGQTRSRHSGGVFVAMCDGSVRFISDFVETTDRWLLPSEPSHLFVWQRLNASHDGQILDDSTY